MQPAIVLVHGAFAESSTWNAVLGPLQDLGHATVAVANPLRRLSSDAQYVTDILRGIAEPVVLVGHAYGGSVISDVPADAADIVGLVFVSAFAPDVGESPSGLAARFPGATLEPTLRAVAQDNGTTDLYIDQDEYRAQVAADVPARVARQMSATQRPIAAAALDDKAVAPLWKSVPSWFMFGELDRTIPVACHRFMAERAGSRRTVEIAGASHVVGMSHPDELGELVLQAACT